MSFPKPIIVRQVYQSNFQLEFAMIQCALVNSYTYISIDTEFPGTVFRSSNPQISPEDVYIEMKINVDLTKIVQLGLTLSDAEGNLPHFRTNTCFIWEFNFKDFDISKDLHNKDSIKMLREQGINFERNRHLGIDSEVFATYFQLSGLVMRSPHMPALTWVTFQSMYDFGYLMKILRRRSLPSDLNSYLQCLREWFGLKVYDVKEMMRIYRIYGGLEKIANHLRVVRVAGKCHQAGSDSLLTMHTFMKLVDDFYDGDKDGSLTIFKGRLYGLQFR